MLVLLVRGAMSGECFFFRQDRLSSSGYLARQESCRNKCIMICVVENWSCVVSRMICPNILAVSSIVFYDLDAVKTLGKGKDEKVDEPPKTPTNRKIPSLLWKMTA